MLYVSSIIIGINVLVKFMIKTTIFELVAFNTFTIMQSAISIPMLVASNIKLKHMNVVSYSYLYNTISEVMSSFANS